MEIVKLHCLGNAYLVVGAEAQQYSLPDLALVLCRGQGAVGSGLIALSPGPPGRRKMELYNSRGVRVEPGASALRCAGYVLGDGSWELDTSSGLQRVDVQGQDTVLWFPPPVFGGEYQIGRDFHGYLVNLVHRYFVTIVYDLRDLDLEFQGQALDRYFGGIEVIFVRDDGTNIGARIWQRGGGEIAGSGTGASAAAATLWRLGRWREPMPLAMKGGTATIYMDRHGRFVQHAAVERVYEDSLEEDFLRNLTLV